MYRDKKSRRGCYRPPGSFGGFKNALGVPQGPTVGPWKRRGRRDENRRSGYVLQMPRRSSGWSRGIQGVQGSLYCTADTTVWVVQHYIRFLLRHSVLFYDLFSPANRRGEPIEIKYQNKAKRINSSKQSHALSTLAGGTLGFGVPAMQSKRIHKLNLLFQAFQFPSGF